MINTLIVDDSAIVRAMVNEVLRNDGRFSVCGTAENGEAAVKKSKECSPDLIIMDIIMPVMNGIEATALIMKQPDPPVIVNFTTEDSILTGYQALEAGSVEVIRKPNLATIKEDELKQFCDKLAVICKNRRSCRKIPSMKPESSPGADKFPGKHNYNVLLIGASTGGPKAIQSVLQSIGANFPLPILVTQHIDTLFDVQFTNWLNTSTGLSVQLATDGCIPEAGKVYIAPANRHLEIRKLGVDSFTLVLNDDPPVHFLKPSVDKMFSSACEAFSDKILAVLLTGMGRDGADGCVEIKRCGGFVVCEDESSCIVYGMPKAAIDGGGANIVLPLKEIGPFIKNSVL